MKNPFDSYLTRNEQKLLGFLGIMGLVGMILYASGASRIYAKKTSVDKIRLEQAVEKDSVIKIDIRSADKSELMFLPGIGPQKAVAIIEYRHVKQFESPEELLNVKGIGAKTFMKFSEMLMPFGKSGAGVTNSRELAEVTSQGISQKNHPELKQELDETSNPQKKEIVKETVNKADDNRIVRLNSANKEELMQLSGIGEKKAESILEYRRQIGRFTSVEQITEVKGIGSKTMDKNRHRLSLD